LVFKKNATSKQKCIEHVDSDYAGDLDKRRSTTGYLFTLSQAPVSWRSTLQSIIALSTTEAKYIAMTEAVKEAIWLQGLLDVLGIDQDLLKINCDSMSAIYLAKSQVYHVRTKHIDVRFHFVQEILDEDDIELQKIHMKENPADMLIQGCFGSEVCTLQRVTSYPSSCVSSVELVWMNYVWLDPVGHGYVGNHNGAIN